MFNISIECLFIIICSVTFVTFVFKKGIHSICLIVLLSYILFFIVDSLILTDLQYYAFDILRIALISIVVLIASELASEKKHYLYYSVVLLSHIVIQFIFMFGFLSNLIFDGLLMVINILELAVFFNGICRTITANNGRRPKGFFTGNSNHGLYRVRDWLNSNITALQKGISK